MSFNISQWVWENTACLYDGSTATEAWFLLQPYDEKNLKVETSIPIRLRNLPTQEHQTTPAQIVTVTDRYIQHG